MAGLLTQFAIDQRSLVKPAPTAPLTIQVRMRWDEGMICDRTSVPT